MKDWDKLMEVEEEIKEREKGEKHPKELARKEKASADVDIEEFSVKGDVSQKQEEELKESAKDTLITGGTTVRNGACQPEDDGDITCKFKKKGMANVTMPWAERTKNPKIPVEVEATIDLKDFDEARAHMMNEVRKSKDVTVIK